MINWGENKCKSSILKNEDPTQFNAYNMPLHIIHNSTKIYQEYKDKAGKNIYFEDKIYECIKSKEKPKFIAEAYEILPKPNPIEKSNINMDILKANYVVHSINLLDLIILQLLTILNKGYIYKGDWMFNSTPYYSINSIKSGNNAAECNMGEASYSIKINHTLCSFYSVWIIELTEDCFIIDSDEKVPLRLERIKYTIKRAIKNCEQKQTVCIVIAATLIDKLSKKKKISYINCGYFNITEKSKQTDNKYSPHKQLYSVTKDIIAQINSNIDILLKTVSTSKNTACSVYTLAPSYKFSLLKCLLIGYHHIVMSYMSQPNSKYINLIVVFSSGNGVYDCSGKEEKVNYYSFLKSIAKRNGCAFKFVFFGYQMLKICPFIYFNQSAKKIRLLSWAKSLYRLDSAKCANAIINNYTLPAQCLENILNYKMKKCKHKPKSDINEFLFKMKHSYININKKTIEIKKKIQDIKVSKETSSKKWLNWFNTEMGAYFTGANNPNFQIIYPLKVVALLILNGFKITDIHAESKEPISYLIIGIFQKIIINIRVQPKTCKILGDEDIKKSQEVKILQAKIDVLDAYLNQHILNIKINKNYINDINELLSTNPVILHQTSGEIFEPCFTMAQKGFKISRLCYHMDFEAVPSYNVKYEAGKTQVDINGNHFTKIYEIVKSLMNKNASITYTKENKCTLPVSNITEREKYNYIDTNESVYMQSLNPSYDISPCESFAVDAVWKYYEVNVDYGFLKHAVSMKVPLCISFHVCKCVAMVECASVDAIINKMLKPPYYYTCVHYLSEDASVKQLYMSKKGKYFAGVIYSTPYRVFILENSINKDENEQPVPLEV